MTPNAAGTGSPAAAGGPVRWVLDAVVALVLIVIGMGGTAPAGAGQPGTAEPGVLAYALVGTAALAVVVRRRWPLVTFGITTAAVASYLALGYPYGPILLSLVVAVYSVAVQLPVRTAAVPGALALAALLVGAPFGHAGLTGALVGMSWVIAPFAAGVAVRISRASAARDREEAIRRHADEERLRIAQEVHDVVGHGLAAITMQADIALHLMSTRPGQAEQALSAISKTSREALDELRATLTVVRGNADRAPTPGLARLDDLLARMSGTGVPVTLEVTGQRRNLPAATDLTAYRVVQESLTNVLRHAGAATATVRLGYRPRELAIEVTNTSRLAVSPALGRSGPSGQLRVRARHTEGHGITGMRERVTALDGTFDAGPTDGGFRVRATLPLSAESPAESPADSQAAEPRAAELEPHE